MALWLQILAPSLLSFLIGAIVGYGRGMAKIATMETNITALQKAVERLENLLLVRS